MRTTIGYGPPVISIDVEDWGQSTWDRNLPITERARENTYHVLELLARAGVRATMFVLGKLAVRFPEVVRAIRASGHEIASHGYGHIEIAAQSREDFRADVARAKDVIEQILGEPIFGYRAPDFSIVHRTLWALEELAEAGYQYDSSVVPVRLFRYGIPEWPDRPIVVELDGGRTILEVPIATIRWMGRNWPVGGGGYHRLLPGFMIRYLACRVMANGPFVFYCHPYEFDRREFEETTLDVPWKVRLHQGLGRRWFERRFQSFLNQFGGQRMQDLLVSQIWPSIPIHRFTNSAPSPQ